MTGYIFGGGTNLTYDQLQRQRQIADAMRGSIGTPTNVGEGLAAIGKALMVRGMTKRLDAEEARQKGAFNDQWASIAGALNKPQPASFNAPQDPNSPAKIGSDTMAALGKPSNGMSADQIRQGLIDRGLSPAVADGFVMNFRDESGLDPSINEKNPTVAGSRGGFGLAQWTGPRRVELEKFAASQGKSVSDPNVQMDFLMTELRGPEAAAAKSFMAAPDAGTAAAAIATNFLRPAQANLDRRVASYTGGQGMDLGTLAEVAASPYASEGQKAIVNLLMQQQMQAMTPQKPIEVGGVLLDPTTHQVLFDSRTKPDEPVKHSTFTGADGAEYSFDPITQEVKRLTDPKATPPGVKYLITPEDRAAAGIPPDDKRPYAVKPGEIPQVIGGAGAGGGANEYGLVPQIGRDKDGNPVMLQPGKDGTAVATKLPDGITFAPDEKAFQTAKGTAAGKAAGDALAQIPGAQAMVAQMKTQVESLKNDPYLPSMLGPIDSRLPNVSSDAARVQAKMNQLQGGVFMQARQLLKGGGQITDFEGTKAEQAYSRLAAAQTPEDYNAALDDLIYYTNAGLEKLAAVSKLSLVPNGPPPSTPQGETVIDGYTITPVQ